MIRFFRPALALFVLFSLLLGGLYPALLTGCAHLLFPRAAEGSLLYDNKGVLVGSALIGQSFSDARYFWGRPSATARFPTNALASGPSNLSPGNLLLRQAVEKRLASFALDKPVPIDLLTASASGLDPDISPAAAYIQIARVASARHMSESAVTNLVESTMQNRTFGLLGMPRVNVLRLNLALDLLQKGGAP